MEERRRRVLVIDDDALLRKMVRRALESEHEIVEVTSAKEALDRIAAGERFDLVLCDLMLPGVSGVDFHERVGPIAPDLVEQIIFTTGGAYTPRAEAFLARADIRHIEKPYAESGIMRSVGADTPATRRSARIALRIILMRLVLQPHLDIGQVGPRIRP